MALTRSEHSRKFCHYKKPGFDSATASTLLVRKFERFVIFALDVICFLRAGINFNHILIRKMYQAGKRRPKRLRFGSVSVTDALIVCPLKGLKGVKADFLHS